VKTGDVLYGSVLKVCMLLAQGNELVSVHSLMRRSYCMFYKWLWSTQWNKI